MGQLVTIMKQDTKYMVKAWNYAKDIRVEAIQPRCPTHPLC